jgi:hypothetical protein
LGVIKTKKLNPSVRSPLSDLYMGIMPPVRTSRMNCVEIPDDCMARSQCQISALAGYCQRKTGIVLGTLSEDVVVYLHRYQIVIQLWPSDEFTQRASLHCSDTRPSPYF